MRTETDLVVTFEGISRFRNAVNTVLVQLEDVRGIAFATIISDFIVICDYMYIHSIALITS